MARIEIDVCVAILQKRIMMIKTVLPKVLESME